MEETVSFTKIMKLSAPVIQDEFLEAEDKLRREKANEIRDIGGRVIRKLHVKNNNILASLSENAILVSQRRLPSDTIFLDNINVSEIQIIEFPIIPGLL